MKYIGLDIGGTNVKLGVLNEENEIIFHTSVPTEAQYGKDMILGKIRNAIHAALHRFDDCASIGIGIPGIVSKQGTIKIAPNLPGFIDIPLGKMLKDKYQIPVSVDNDANTAAIAEMYLGVAKEESDFIFISLGTGIGGAIIHDRKIFRGKSGGAGEIGHMIINCNECIESPKPFRTGILESYTGRRQIIGLAEKILENYPDSALKEYNNPDPFFITKALNDGDKASEEIFRKTGFYLGIGLASAMNLLDIRLIVYGGGLSEAHPLMFESAAETIRERSLPNIASSFQLKKAKFSKDAGVIGAALLGIKNPE